MAQFSNLTVLAGNGPGLFLLVGTTNVQLRNSVLRQTYSSGAMVLSYSDNVAVSDCNVQGGSVSGLSGTFATITNLTDVNPQFVNAAGPDGDLQTWQDNDLHLSQYSPMIDAGPIPDSTTVSLLDLDGNTFKSDGNNDGVTRIDIGAYEFRGGSGVCRADFNNDHIITPSDVAEYVNAWVAALSQGCP